MDLYTTNTISGNGTQESPLGIVGDLFYYGEVNAYLNSTNGNIQVNATVPDGYRFLTWLGTDVATRGESNTIGLIWNDAEPTSARLYGIAKYNADNSHAYAAYLCIRNN